MYYNHKTVIPHYFFSKVTNMSETKKYQNANYCMYRANKDKNGAASKFNLSKKPDDNKCQLFLEMAKQTGENENKDAVFGWRQYDSTSKTFNNLDKSVSMKLGTADIGELLAVISGRKDFAGTGKGLYHENQRGHTTLEFRLYQKDKDSPALGFILSTNSVNKETKDSVKVSHVVSFADGEVLRVFLNNALMEINKWNFTE